MAKADDATETGPALDELRRLVGVRALMACDPDGVAAMGRLGRLEDADEGAWLLRAGSPADALRFIVSGRVALTVDVPGAEPRTLGTLGRGEMLGWSALRPRGTFTLDARALKPTRCVVLAADPLRALLDDRPRFGLCVMRYVFGVVAQRLADARVQLLDMYAHPTRSV